MGRLKFLVKIFCFVLMIVFLLSLNNTENIFKNKFDYSGTNGLFIEYIDDGISFNWITNQVDSGYYQLKNQKNKLIEEGFTPKNRVHHIQINTKIDDGLRLTFGGKNSQNHTTLLYPNPKLEKSNYTNVDSIFVVGDVHGEYDRLVNLLITSNVIDSDLNWIAGSSHLVFLGDLFDRGNKVTKTLWFIYELEQQAKKFDGKVHLVLGNHEIMVMSKDLRYLSKKEKNLSIAYKVSYDKLFHPKKTILGNWLKSKTSVLKIDDILFAHGGVSDLEGKSIKKFNKQASDYIDHPAFLDLMKSKPVISQYKAEEWMRLRQFFYGENSPYWYRGYSLSDTLIVPLNNILKKYEAKIHIVGHTPSESIRKKYQGKLITTDLNQKATQLLLLINKNGGYETFKYNIDGVKTEF